MTQRWRLVNPSLHGNPNQVELYDIEKDPGQKINIAAQHPDVVASLKAEYESWWKRVSAGGHDYVRIVIGSDQENPSTLTSMDWHGDGSETTWNQTQIRSAPLANGFWALDVSRAGHYRFELRRWPRELDLPINAPYTNPKPNRETTPGAAIAATRANIMIRDVNLTKPVLPEAKFVEFEFDLPLGPAELRTAFYDAVMNERGAYYLYGERV